MSGGTIRTSDGRTLAWEDRGDPAGVPVISHHGTPGSRLNRHPDPDFYEQRGIRFIAYDRPGYGESTRQPGRAVADAAADTRALADELGLDRFAVAGGSGGGPHALACGALLGARVTRIGVFVGVAPSDDPGFDFLEGMSPSNVEEFEAARRGREPLEALLESHLESMSQDPFALFDEIEDELPEPDRVTGRREDVRAVMRESAREAIRQGIGGWADDSLAFANAWGFELSDVRVPVRLWQGELDVLVPRQHAEYLTAKLPDASFELLPNTGHLLFDELGPVYEWLAAPG